MDFRFQQMWQSLVKAVSDLPKFVLTYGTDFKNGCETAVGYQNITFTVDKSPEELRYEYVRVREKHEQVCAQQC